MYHSIKRYSSKLLFFSFILLISSCAKIFYTEDAVSLASSQKSIAILPPTVSIAASKKVDAEAIKQQQKTESLNFQKEIYAWMLKRKMQGKISQEIQEVEMTNAKLLKAGYPDSLYTNEQLCKILGVDGIITSNFSLSKPVSDGGAIALGLLVGAWAATNEVHASLSIKDCSTKKLIWNYDHKYSGSIGSTPAQLVDGLMRHASRKMPYILY